MFIWTACVYAVFNIYIDRLVLCMNSEHLDRSTAAHVRLWLLIFFPKMAPSYWCEIVEADCIRYSCKVSKKKVTTMNGDWWARDKGVFFSIYVVSCLNLYNKLLFIRNSDDVHIYACKRPPRRSDVGSSNDFFSYKASFFVFITNSSLLSLFCFAFSTLGNRWSFCWPSAVEITLYI